jgi:hypothetical protein
MNRNDGGLRVVKKLAPDQPGALKLAQKYGDALICVRHRIDSTGQVRTTTVELRVDQAPIRPRSDRIVGVRIDYAERALQIAAKAAGATWDPQARLWRMPIRAASALGLRARVAEG